VSGSNIPLPVVDACELDARYRHLLHPGELMRTRTGAVHRLPRFFYEVTSTAHAVNTQLTPHFGLWEFMEVDLHEPEPLRTYPRYVPCAVMALAAALEVLRLEIGAPIRIAANGGYRSPAHAASASGSPHCWGTAVNIYRIGSEYLDSEERIGRYSDVASRVLAGCWTRPYGHDVGFADDHLHFDLGYGTVVPHQSSEDGPPSASAASQLWRDKGDPDTAREHA
jgi:hypothetical protein